MQAHLERSEEISPHPGIESSQSGEEEAQWRAETEQQLTIAVGVLREQEEEQVRRLDELQAQLATQVKAFYLAEAEAQQHAEKADQINLELENAIKNRDDGSKRVEEADLRLRELEGARRSGEVRTQGRTEKERHLDVEIEALRQAEEEQLKRIEEPDSTPRSEEARQMARARSKATGLKQNNKSLPKSKSCAGSKRIGYRIKEAEARLPGLKKPYVQGRKAGPKERR